MLKVHSNSTLNHINTYDPSNTRQSGVKVDLRDFNATLNQINDGNSDSVAKEMTRRLEELIPKLEKGRIALEKTLKEGEVKTGFKLDDGTDIGFVASKVDGLVSYFIRSDSGEIIANEKGSTEMPFGYVTVEDGKLRSADMWTPKSQRNGQDGYQRIGLRKSSPDEKYSLETQLTFSRDTKDVKESLRLAQKLLASNPKGELATDIETTLTGAPVKTYDGRSTTINALHKLAA